MANLFDIPLKTITGEPTTLAPYQGKVLLLVNVASKCGLTPQYSGLEKLYKAYKDKGFEILGFPANDFAGQEPGTSEEILTFCSTQYDVTFPLFEKVVATGPEKAPIYAALIEAQPTAVIADPGFKDNLRGYGLTVNPDPELTWNFEKFLINRHGEVVGRFAPDTVPEAPQLVAAIEAAL